MKFTMSWLRDHLETDADVATVTEAMTLAGLEVEGVENPGAELSQFTVAKVVSAEKHPDADKLKVCEVDTVDGRKTIVCGAPNARAPMTVAYAPLGAYIPGADFSLDDKPRKIRGVASSGMMCSASELGLGEDSDGIMDLSSDLRVGMTIAQALELDDPVIDFEVTPNRPDWLGVDGIARDLAATGLGRVVTPDVEAVPGVFANSQAIAIDAPAGCPAFAGRVVRGVRNGPSPDWLQARLRSIGLRPINALVDITNFITIDRARPLHFYDADKLSGPIRARWGEGESFDALDKKHYTATGEDVVIADESGILGLGGIVGGKTTGCEMGTTSVFIESAYFDPLTIRRTAKRLGVNSDAKYRFERGVDPGFVRDGVELATRMILKICGGEAGEVEIVGELPEAPAPIAFDTAKVEQLTGLRLAETEMRRILEALGFGIAVDWTVTVPSWRRDCTMAADLVEEIARIAGFHNLEAVSLPPLSGRREPTATPLQNRTRLARRALAQRGLDEAVTWSFAARDEAAPFGDLADLTIANPISSDLDVMRPSALIHLLTAGQRAADRGYPGMAAFELGPVFSGQEPADQRTSLAGMRRVEAARDWRGSEAPDALSAKADAVAALEAMSANTANLQVMTAVGEYWHPGRSASLRMGPKTVLASFGELHPRVLKALGVSGRVVAFEVWPEALPAPRRKMASKAKGALDLSDLMPVHRDFAFVVDAETPAGDLLRAARKADKALITDVTLFDVYEGLEDGAKKSLAINVELTPREATLTDAQIEAVSAKVVSAAEKIGAVLRG